MAEYLISFAVAILACLFIRYMLTKGMAKLLNQQVDAYEKLIDAYEEKIAAQERLSKALEEKIQLLREIADDG